MQKLTENGKEIAPEETEEVTEETVEEAVPEEMQAEEAAIETEETEEAPEAPQEKKERKLNWTKKAKEEAEEAGKEEEDKAQAQLNEANERYTRLFAEFDNFRKRSEKEKASMFGMGARSVIEKMLDVLDSLERGLSTVPEEEKEVPFVVGMDKVYKQFLKTLDDLGVKPIEAVGKEFDPNFHNAVMHVEDENAGVNIVVEEFQKGYTYKDTVVRYSMVKVAN